ncbi:MAG: hypothetical protein U0168_10610 [Nannocystaceae bacterium]
MTPRRTQSRAALALALLPALALPPTAHAAPAASESQPIRAGLSIEAKLRDPKSTLPERIRVRGEALLREREVLPARGEDDPRIVIAIEPLQGAQGYRCRFGAWQGEQAIDGTDGVSLCELCTEGELVEHVGAAITRVVAQLPRDGGTAAATDPGHARSRSAAAARLGPAAARCRHRSDRRRRRRARGRIPLAVIRPRGAEDGASPRPRPTRGRPASRWPRSVPRW